MNEREIALLVRQALDRSAERLPYRVTHRLAASRAEALTRVSEHQPEMVPASALRVPASALRPVRAGEAGAAGAPPPLRWRVAAVVAPILIVGAGLAGIALWDSWQRADDIAAIEAAMLADDVPIAAYADRGFGVYLKNVSHGKNGQ